MVTTLYIVRHCQSAGNLSGRFQGRFDAPVSPVGEKQLELLSLRFRNLPLDAIYSSPLLRAYRTAEAIGKFHQIPIQTRDGLLEIDVGDIENQRLSDIGEQYPELACHWDHFPDLCVFPGGETMVQVYQRINETIDQIVAENLGKHVAVSTHGGVIRNLYARVQYGSIEGLRKSVVFGNTSVSVLEVEDGSFRWKSVNDLSHLPEELRHAPTQYTFHTEAI